MKKAFIVTSSILLILLSAFSVCAENETYFISDLNLSIDVPSNYNVFTRDMEEDSYTLKKYGYTKEELLNILEESNIYFDGFNNSASEEIVITASKIRVSDIAIFEYDELEEMIDDSIENHEAKGAEVLDCSIYVNSKTTYIVTTLCDPTEGNAINYYTINNYDAINITCWTYENALDNSKKEFFASIIDGITFNAYNGVTTLPASDDNHDTTNSTTPVNDDNMQIYEDTFVFNIAENGKLTPLGESLITTAVVILIQLIAGGVVLIILLKKKKKRRQMALSQSIKTKNKFCIFCGTELKADDTFCHICGKSQVITQTTENTDIS